MTGSKPGVQKTSRGQDRANSSPWLWWGLLIPIAGALVAVVAVTLSWAPRLPGEVANQWADGQVTTVRSLPATIASLALPAAAFWAVLAGYVAVGRAATAWVRRTTIGVLAALVVTVTLALPIVVVASLGVADPWLAPDPGLASFGSAALIGAVVGTTTGLLTRPAPTTAHAGTPPQVTSSATTEHVFVAPLAAAVAATSGVLVVLGATRVVWWPVAFLGGAGAAVALVGLRWRVAVTGTEFALGPVVGPGAVTVRREPGASAQVDATRPAWGPLGWGIHLSRRGSSQVLLGGGDVLVLRRSDGTELRVTVPRAAELAAEFHRDRD